MPLKPNKHAIPQSHTSKRPIEGFNRRQRTFHLSSPSLYHPLWQRHRIRSHRTSSNLGSELKNLDNRIQIAEATLALLTDDLHRSRIPVQVCHIKLKNHPRDDGARAELGLQLKDSEKEESGKVAQIQTHLQQISSVMEETFRERCAEEVRAVGMKMKSPEDRASRLLEESRSVAVRLWEVRDEMVARNDELAERKEVECGI